MLIPCTGRLYLLASLFFVVYTTASLSALHWMNIPMYTALNQCTPIVSLVLGVAVFKQPCPPRKERIIEKKHAIFPTFFISCSGA